MLHPEVIRYKAIREQRKNLVNSIERKQVLKNDTEFT